MKKWVKGKGWYLYKKIQRRRLLWRDGGRGCVYCACCFVGTGNRQRTVDHRIPLSGGGTWRLANLVFACGACNRRKGNIGEDEFRGGEWLAQRRVVVARELARVA